MVLFDKRASSPVCIVAKVIKVDPYQTNCVASESFAAERTNGCEPRRGLFYYRI
jgi:hypothetical protein